MKKKLKNLEQELAAAKQNNANLQASLVEEMRKASAAIADRFKIQQHEKKLLVIDHITAGRANEAIQEILKPLPVLFRMDVRFADDKTRFAAEEELLKSVVHRITQMLEGLKLKKAEVSNGNAPAGESQNDNQPDAE